MEEHHNKKTEKAQNEFKLSEIFNGVVVGLMALWGFWVATSIIFHIWIN